MTSVQIVGLLLMAGGCLWVVFSKPMVKSTPSRQPSTPSPRPEAKDGLATRLDALVALDALLTYCTETKNVAGVSAVQQAMAAVVQVTVDE